jgi:hypothetical protein
MSTTTTESSPANNKGLQTKFSCAICSTYGHYTHHCPSLTQFRQTLAVVGQKSQPGPPPALPTNTHITDIRYVSTSVPEHMRCPCTLCDSLAHLTYQCPLIIEYRFCQSTPIQPYMTTLLHVMQVTSPIPSPDTFHIFSPEPESLPIPPWFTLRLYKDVPSNPRNSLEIFPQEIFPPTTIHYPQDLDIWFISNNRLHPIYTIPYTSSHLEDNHAHLSQVPPIPTQDHLSSLIFHCDEYILDKLTTPYCPCNALHH